MEFSTEQNELYGLALEAIEGGISRDAFARLEHLLRESDECRAVYADLSLLYAYLRRPALTFDVDENLAFDATFWKELAAYEKTAPETVTLDQKPRHELIQKVLYPPRQKRRLSKFGIVFVAMNAAALLFILLFLRFVPARGNEVAILTDSLGAKWSDVEGKMVNGTSIAAGDGSLLLSEGYAQFLFDNHAKVTVQGPAEFQISADDQIKLIYGRLYAMVPREAIGFTVKTPSAQIVDLGTEFGVDTDLRSDTSIHVIKGKTVLIAGDKSNKVSIEIKEGGAKQVSAATQTISDIACNDHLFVREINSDGHLIWRGETQISVADVVAGGNGFGKVSALVGLNPGTGQYTSAITESGRGSVNAYNRVTDSKFIDGVFVPDGRTVVTSSNDTFQCPDTRGKFTHEIAVFTGDIGRHHPTIKSVIFNGQTYENSPVVMIHSNAGITFDLGAIRQSMPNMNLTKFESLGGFTEAFKDVQTGLPDVDFWVLVDGQIRYEKKAVKLEDGQISITVELNPQDRFLTLIVTDGSSAAETNRQYTAWNNDFFYLVDPTLQMSELAH